MKTEDISAPSYGGETLRCELVAHCLAELGKTWAETFVLEMAKAQRRIEGGWPGRLAEARMLAVRELAQELATRGFAPPTAAEFAPAPGVVNEHARKEWLRAMKAEQQQRRGHQKP